MLTSAGLALALDSRGQEPAKPAGNAPAPQAGLPPGKIGKLEVSRLILGGNLLTHYTHSRDLKFPGYGCRNPEETTAFMKTVDKPWIA